MTSIGQFTGPFCGLTQGRGSSIIENGVHCRKMMLIKGISTVLLKSVSSCRVPTTKHIRSIVSNSQQIQYQTNCRCNFGPFSRLHSAHLNIRADEGDWENEVPTHSRIAHSNSNNEMELWGIHRHHSSVTIRGEIIFKIETINGSRFGIVQADFALDKRIWIEWTREWLAEYSRHSHKTRNRCGVYRIYQSVIGASLACASTLCSNANRIVNRRGWMCSMPNALCLFARDRIESDILRP